MTFDPEDVRQPLTEQERSWLESVEACREKGVPPLASRHVEDVSIVGVDFLGTWSNALVERATFVGCGFRGCDFSSTMLRGVRFERCTFERCRYDAAIFQECHFVACELSDGTLKRTSLHDCKLIDSQLTGLNLYEVRFDGVRIESGKLAQVRLSECMVHLFELVSTELEAVRLTLCEAGRLVLSSCSTSELCILGGRYGSFEMSQGRLSDVAFASAAIDSLWLSNVHEANRLRINEMRVAELSLEHCAVSDLYVWRSEIATLAVRGGAYDGWITACMLGPGSRVEDAELSSFFWDETQAISLTFSRTSFERFLCARSAHFVEMKLEEVRYTSGFELVLDGARFERSDRFIPTTGVAP